MGLSVVKTAESEKTHTIRVPLTVNVTYEDIDEKTGMDRAPETLEVVHIMRLPDTKEREKYNQMMVKVKGASVKAIGYNEATFWLWTQCIVDLEGYDELPEQKAQWVKLFNDSTLLRIHAERATEALLSHINAAEGDISKK